MNFLLMGLRTIMNDIYITLTRRQAKWLLRLIDSLSVALGVDSPIELTSIRQKVFGALYPDQAG